MLAERPGEVRNPGALRYLGIGLLDQPELVDLLQPRGELLGHDGIGIGNNGKGHIVVLVVVQEGHRIAEIAVILGPLVPGKGGELLKHIAVLAIGDAVVLDLQEHRLTNRFQCDPVVPEHKLVVDVLLIVLGPFVVQERLHGERRLLGQVFVFKFRIFPVCLGQVKECVPEQEQEKDQDHRIPEQLFYLFHGSGLLHQNRKYRNGL